MSFFLLVLAVFLSSCASSKESSDSSRPLVQDKYRLVEDRKTLEDLRQDIPEEKKKDNDELAFLLKLMEKPEMQPSKIRESFSRAVSKKRETFQKDMTRKREAYVKDERRQRDEFQKSMDQEKKAFAGQKKVPSEQRREFYANIEDRRREFYMGLRERRDAFEADMRDERRNFDDYMREKNSEFNQEMRSYQSRYDQAKKDKVEAEKLRQQQFQNNSSYQLRPQEGPMPNGTSARGFPLNQTIDELEREFREINKQPSQRLGTDEDQ